MGGWRLALGIFLIVLLMVVWPVGGYWLIDISATPEGMCELSRDLHTMDACTLGDKSDHRPETWLVSEHDEAHIEARNTVLWIIFIVISLMCLLTLGLIWFANSKQRQRVEAGRRKLDAQKNQLGESV